MPRVYFAVLALGVCLSVADFIDDRRHKTPDWHMQLTLGDIYYDLGRFDLALKCYTQASFLNQSQWMPVIGVSKVYFVDGKKDVAADLYGQAFPKLNPDFQKMVLREKKLDPLREYIKSRTAQPAAAAQTSP